MNIVIRHADAARDALAILDLRGGDVLNDKQQQQYLVAIDIDQGQNGIVIVGCIRVRKVSFYQAEIMHLYVHAAYRRQGIGRKLLEAALAKARDLKLPYVQCTVRTTNHGMRMLACAAGGVWTVEFKSPISTHKLDVYHWLVLSDVATIEPGTYADWQRDDA